LLRGHFLDKTFTLMKNNSAATMDLNDLRQDVSKIACFHRNAKLHQA